MRTQILVAVHGDDAPTRDALALGITLARSLDGDLLLASIWASPLGAGDGLTEHAVRFQIEHELARLRHAVPDDVFVRSQVRGSTSVAHGLCKVAADHRADVLVLGAALHGHAGRRLRGDLVFSTVHDAPCTVAVAPSGLRSRDDTGRTDVAVAWDGSAPAVRALEVAIGIVRRTGGTLRVVFVLEPPRRHAIAPLTAPVRASAWSTAVITYAKRLLAEAQERVAGRVPVDVQLRAGQVAVELAAAAEPCLLLVGGAPGAWALQRFLAGDATAELLDRVTVPVLLVPRVAAYPRSRRSSAPAAA